MDRRQDVRMARGRGMVLAVIVLGTSMAGAAWAQGDKTARTTATAAPGSATAKTLSRDSSLEGLWISQFGTPIERNPAFGQRETLTEQERATITKAANDARIREETLSRRVSPRGSEQDVN